MSNKYVVGYIAWVVSSGAQAQSSVEITDPPTAPSEQVSPPAAAGGEEPGSEKCNINFEFKSKDGSPVNPELREKIEKQLLEECKANSGASPEAADSSSAGDAGIVVSGQRARGSAIGDVPPEVSFDAFELKAFGANSIEDLIETLGPQVSSNRGRGDSEPVVLLNGKRISGFSEVAKIPVEAIERLDVLPEEVALKYGYRADQKVVNVVTYAKFGSKIAQLTYAAPTEGGRNSGAANANYLRIREDARVNLDANYDRSTSLLESERDVRQSSENQDFGQYRALLPQTERLTLNGTLSASVLEGVSSTVNARFEASNSERLLGLGPDNLIRRVVDRNNMRFGTSLGGLVGRWQWSLTGAYDRTRTDTTTDAGDGLGTSGQARSINEIANADLALSGSALKLPAGDVWAGVRGGVATRDFSSKSLRDGAIQIGKLSRDTGSFQVNIDLPIANRKTKALPWLGYLSVGVNAGLEKNSDFKTLHTFGTSLYWAPISEINFIASTTQEEGAPTVDQLGAPLIVTPGIRTYDYTRRETADVALAFGGNPNLRSDERQVFSFGVNATPFSKADLTLSFDYLSSRIDNPVVTFPIATPGIEAAFPERFTRDASGRLVQIDSRPLNFRRANQQQLRWGVNFTSPLEPGAAVTKVITVSGEAEVRRRFPNAKITMVEPGSASSERIQNLSSRLVVSLYYTLHTEDSVVPREGVPALDFLNGSAKSSRGGQSRHEIEFQLGAFKRGLGARLVANWQSGTTIQELGTGIENTVGDFRFSSYGIVNLNLFLVPADRFAGPNTPKWLKQTRVTLGFNNLFNSRPHVKDGAGFTPLSYQSAYLDPLGRSVSLNLRKVF